MGQRADVVVLGAGPAGCAAATTVARNGGTVVLVTGRRPPRTFGIGEGGPPGLDRTVEDVFGPGAFEPADHLRSLGNRAAWGSGELLGTDFMLNPFGTGWHLDRLAFDARLITTAEAAGVDVRSTLDDAPDSVAAIVVDTTGRRAGHARRHGAERVARDRLVAAVAVYERAGTDDDATTTVEAVEAGWWYSCPIPAGRRVVAFLTDGDLLPAEHRTAAGFDRAARATTHVAAPLSGTAPTVPLVVAADTAHLDRPCGGGWRAAGDAAASFDPLSSQGIITAVLMGREAGRTLDDPDAFAARYREIVARHEADRRAIYQRETRWPAAPFWRRRRTG